MSLFPNIRLAVGTCLVVGLLAGCNSSGTLPVTGKVTKGGQPVSGALVTFVPQGADGQPASGTTDDSGTYKLTTFVHGDGALPNSYKVAVTKFAGAAAADASTAAGGGTQYSESDVDAAYRAMEAKGVDVTNPKGVEEARNELPAKYANAESSGLTAEVTSGGTNSFDFDVSEN
jgi:hypothetical protein